MISGKLQVLPTAPADNSTCLRLRAPQLLRTHTMNIEFHEDQRTTDTTMMQSRNTLNVNTVYKSPATLDGELNLI